MGRQDHGNNLLKHVNLSEVTKTSARDGSRGREAERLCRHCQGQLMLAPRRPEREEAEGLPGSRLRCLWNKWQSSVWSWLECGPLRRLTLIELDRRLS